MGNWILCTSQVNEHKQMQHVETECFIISHVDVSFAPKPGVGHKSGGKKRWGKGAVCVFVCVFCTGGTKERERAGMTE